MRQFCIFETPHMADPAWVAPVVEVLGRGSEKQYADAEELQKISWNMQRELGRQSGMVEEASRASQYMSSIGLSVEQIRAYHFFRPSCTETVRSSR